MLLSEIYRNFFKQAMALTALVESTTILCDLKSCVIREMCIVRLHDNWARYCRELIIVSSYGKPVTETGITVPQAPNIKRRQDVIPLLLSRYLRQRYEPHWHFPNESLRAARLLGIRNFGAVNSGLSISPSPIDDLTDLRNYLVHKRYETILNVQQIKRNLLLPISLKPDELIISVIPPGVTVFRKWVTELTQLAHSSIQ